MNFKDVKKNDEVYSLIYGHGLVDVVSPKETRMEGFYIFSVKFENNKIVHYTEDGVPNWCGDDCGTKTLYYTKDIDFNRIDFKPSDDSLSIKKINKLRSSGKIEMKCPSGLWRNIDECPLRLVSDAVSNSKTYLFRLVNYIGKERRERD